MSSSRPNPEALAMRDELAHPHTTFQPCMCGLCGGAAAVATALIGYDDAEVAAGMTKRRKRVTTLDHYSNFSSATQRF
jgi:hypothetical protein